MIATFPNVQSLYLETGFVAVRPPKVDFSRLPWVRTVVDVSLGGALVQSDPVIAPEDAWLYTAEWIAGEKEASAQRDAGLGVVYNSVEDFLSSLSD